MSAEDLKAIEPLVSQASYHRAMVVYKEKKEDLDSEADSLAYSLQNIQNQGGIPRIEERIQEIQQERKRNLQPIFIPYNFGNDDGKKITPKNSEELGKFLASLVKCIHFYKYHPAKLGELFQLGWVYNAANKNGNFRAGAFACHWNNKMAKDLIELQIQQDNFNELFGRNGNQSDEGGVVSDGNNDFFFCFTDRFNSASSQALTRVINRTMREICEELFGIPVSGIEGGPYKDFCHFGVLSKHLQVPLVQDDELDDEQVSSLRTENESLKTENESLKQRLDTALTEQRKAEKQDRKSYQRAKELEQELKEAKLSIAELEEQLEEQRARSSANTTAFGASSPESIRSGSTTSTLNNLGDDGDDSTKENLTTPESTSSEDGFTKFASVVAGSVAGSLMKSGMEAFGTQRQQKSVKKPATTGKKKTAKTQSISKMNRR